MDRERVVITGIGLTAPNANNLADFRHCLLHGISRVQEMEVRYMGKLPAGICSFDPLKYQSKKELRNGTRAGSIGVFCAQEALLDAGIQLDAIDTARIGVYVGVTEHGNVETENEVFNLGQFNYDVKFWPPHHNPRTIANNPAGTITLKLGIRGPHYTIGAACAAGNAGLIQAVQMLRLDEVDLAIAGGVSESIYTFGIFAGFRSQGALGHGDDPNKVSRPFDRGRNGIVISEGGCLFTVERLVDAQKRGAKIYGEIVGYGMNTDATDAVLPNAERQAQCIRLALKRANLRPWDVDIVNTHATSTPMGDVVECEAIREVFGDTEATYINNTKSFIGHTMGAAGALELAGNLPAFNDGYVHPTINIDDLDPQCVLRNLVIGEAKSIGRVKIILNTSFGMLGTNSAVIVRKFEL
ncbi:MAG: beta-ketoacyl-[acyl-carrier-protein] synthase family protein [Puniceicoccales bacterium]|jgi:3-oxoacyl-[acyl-carrier-protein] synthase II|nr:beta-ketoacyl-[acyl-carrier-protein] synthase family protein [Puniceicoccales bacterium]